MTYLVSCNFISRSNKNTNMISGIIQILLVFTVFFFSGCVSLDPLSQAAVNNDVEEIKTLINQGADVNKLNTLRSNSHTALCSAIEVGNHDAVKTLLEFGADPNIFSSFYGTIPNGDYGLIGSPLMEAVIEEDIIIVEMLLKAGADPNAISKEGGLDRTEALDSLGYNARNGNLDIARLLLKYGANPNRIYPNKSKAAYEAISNNHIDFVALLIESGLEIEIEPAYRHFNADIAHIAAAYYAPSNEKRLFGITNRPSSIIPMESRLTTKSLMMLWRRKLEYIYYVLL